MALDVWVGMPSRSANDLVASFEPEAYYTFLIPLFEELEKICGKMIDLYDGAIFESGELASVLELVDKAEVLITSQPEQFEVHVGTYLGSYNEPANEEIYQTVDRSHYLEFISRLRSAVIQAKNTNKPLVFFGD